MLGMIPFVQLHGELLPLATLLIFILTYCGIAVGGGYFFRLDRVGIALLGAIAMLAFGCVSLKEAVNAVNFDSILLLFALMVIASQLYFAGFYTWIATFIAQTLDRPWLFMGVLIFSSGFLSAFLNNDVIALAFAPVVTVTLLRKSINPVPFLIALAFATNIGCAFTLIGNAQNVLIGALGNLSFEKYMLFSVVPVTLSLSAAWWITWRLGRKHLCLNEPSMPFAEPDDDVPFNAWRVTKGVGILVILVFLFVFSPLPRSLTALTGAGLLLCSRRLESRKVLSGVDWQLLVLFIGLFVVTGALMQSQLAQNWEIELRETGLDLDNPFQIAVLTGILSNLINNSAAVMLLTHLNDLTTSPTAAYAMAAANAFAGNFLLFGSLANIIVVQRAETLGVRIGFWTFARYGLPVGSISFLILLTWLYIYGQWI